MTINQLLHDIQIQQQIQLTSALKAVTELDIRQTQVLKLIANKPGLIQKDIADAVNHRAASVSVLLKNLEKAGYLVREIPDDNTRNKQIFLTEQGQHVVDVFTQAQADIHERLLSQLTPSQQDELAQLLTLVKTGLTQ